MVGNVKHAVERSVDKRKEVAEQLLKGSGPDVITEFCRFLKSQAASNNKTM